MPERSYFDWNATAPLRNEARAAIAEALSVPGNPSSVHAEGRAARRLIEKAREEVAALVGARAGDVFFTSSGTEANMLALTPAIEVAGDKRPRSKLLLSAVEHVSVRAGGRFAREAIEELPVDAQGRLDLAALADAVAKSPRALVSLMLANNETGVIQPVAEAAAIVHAAGGLLHVDAVQAAGRIDCDIAALGADLLTLSAHKIGGPKGVGALVRASDDIHLPRSADPRRRAGAGAARRHRKCRRHRRLRRCRCRGSPSSAQPRPSTCWRCATVLETGLRAIAPGTVIFGANAARLPNTTLFTVPGMKAETAVIAFDLEGVAVSSGAACSSGKVQPSHVLAAMGVLPPLTRGAVRASLGWSTTEADIESFLKAWRKLASALSKGQPSVAA